jgi:hypothetical protein
MRALLKKILFGQKDIKEYQSVKISGNIEEKAYLKSKNGVIDISNSHWLLCLEPTIFGIWLSNPEYDINDTFKIFFTNKESGIDEKVENISTTELTLIFFDKIEEKNGTLLLLKTIKTKISNSNYFKGVLMFLVYYYKSSQTFFKFKSLYAAYSYPRKVNIISFKENNYYNLFPMDLLGGINETNKHVLGLRHGNMALSGIIKAGKIIICEVSSKYKSEIYALGKHHSSDPPSIESLPFKVFYSRNFGFPLPEWIDSYKEINIQKSINLGSQMLLWGELIEEVKIKETSGNLFHLHLLHLFSDDKKSNYPLA